MNLRSPAAGDRPRRPRLPRFSTDTDPVHGAAAVGGCHPDPGCADAWCDAHSRRSHANSRCNAHPRRADADGRPPSHPGIADRRCRSADDRLRGGDQTCRRVRAEIAVAKPSGNSQSGNDQIPARRPGSWFLSCRAPCGNSSRSTSASAPSLSPSPAARK
jgi:hypothetical protein